MNKEINAIFYHILGEKVLNQGRSDQFYVKDQKIVKFVDLTHI